MSTGADYNLTETLYGLVEYHYNGAGTGTPADYPSLFSHTAYIEGAVYLLGLNYVTPGITWQISPLLTFVGEALWNLSDMSFSIYASLDYSFADDVTLEAGAYVPAGRPSIYGPAGLDTVSEFGLYPAVYYASIKVYY